jgi:hypothetical protein
VHVLAGEHSVAAHIPPRATVHANFAHGRVLGEQREKTVKSRLGDCGLAHFG